MRRDLCYFYPLPVEQVYEAFVQAANQKFGKNCRVDPCKTINFGLNFSFKYNMNGGSMTLHFMPYQNGTAINLRYTIVQAMGARYKAHARDFTMFVNGILKSQGQLIRLDVNKFLEYEANAPSVAPSEMPMTSMQMPSSQPAPQSPQNTVQPPQTVQPVQPVQQPMPQPVQQARPVSQEAVPMHAVNMKPNPPIPQAAPAYAAPSFGHIPAPVPAPIPAPITQPEEPADEIQTMLIEDELQDEQQTMLIEDEPPDEQQTMLIEDDPVQEEQPGYPDEAQAYEPPAAPEEMPQEEAPAPPAGEPPVPVRRFCTNCGAKLFENALFCVRCGCRLN